MPAWGVRTALVALRSFMETDVKGQLGGLECSKEERERIARNTPVWTCGVCGRSNGEILREAEEAAKAEGNTDEAEVPKELSMGYKDEMTAARKEEVKMEVRSAQQRMDDDTEAELAEGFVRTGLDGAADQNHAPATETSATIYPPARPAQTVPQPTAAVVRNAPRVAAANAYPMQVAQRRSDDEGVPVWLDRAIGGVIFCLVALVLKVLLGL